MPLLESLKNRVFGTGKSVKLVVYVPEETPANAPVFISGACQKLGEWNPTGFRLKRVDKNVWQGRVHLPPDQPVEFKVTRGSWDSVEKAADGGDVGNTWVNPQELADGVIRHRVERWSDAG